MLCDISGRIIGILSRAHICNNVIESLTSLSFDHMQLYINYDIILQELHYPNSTDHTYPDLLKIAYIRMISYCITHLEQANHLITSKQYIRARRRNTDDSSSSPSSNLRCFESVTSFQYDAFNSCIVGCIPNKM